MDKRTRILALAFSALIGLWFGSKTVYSWWIKPLFTIQEDIKALEVKAEDAADFHNGYNRAQWEYETLVSRVGAMQVGALKGDLHRRLEELAHKHQLGELKIAPKLPQKFGKTECTQLGFTISGQQKLADVLGFLRDVYELPHIIKVLDPRFQPIIPPRDKKPEDLVKISLEVQALLLPPRPRPKLDYVVDKKELADQPASFVRHGEVDVLALAKRKPFLEYEERKVVIKDPAEPQDTGPKKGPVVAPATCKPWKGNWKIVAISMMHEPLLQRVLAQDGTKTSSQKYIAPGEEFDGGMLDTVTTLAVLVRYHDGNYVYPLGGEFKERIKASEADRYPMLKERAESLPPLTQEEIKALPSKAGKTVTASTASSSSSKSGSDKKGAPAVNRTPPTGSASSSGRTTTPGRLSSPVRTESGNGTKGIPAPIRPTGSAGSPPASRGAPEPASDTPGSPDPNEEAEEAESTGENPPAEPAPPSPPGPPDNM